MTLVVDASVVVSALIDAGPEGTWAEQLLSSDDLASAHLMPSEVANILRRAAFAGDISQDSASLAHDDLLMLSMELFPYEPFARRVWELRNNLSAYDAWYVALAETLDSPLATLDLRLTRSPGLRCEFRTFESS
jgi:predicted nucleic acid-binding protein